MKSKLYKIAPNTYLFEFKKHFDMGMSFLRMQEFYECSSDEFKGKVFDVFEYMKYYADKEDKKYFSYTEDYVGYNIPSWVVDKFRNVEHNYFEKELFKQLNKIKDKKFYLIGAKKGKIRVLKHEIAHALYYNNNDYKEKMLGLISEFSPKTIKKIYKIIGEMGYSESVYDDELQAYFSTGLIDDLVDIKNAKPMSKKFKKVFDKHYKYYKKFNKDFDKVCL